jgi:hypothetical protein
MNKEEQLALFGGPKAKTVAFTKGKKFDDAEVCVFIHLSFSIMPSKND